MEQVDKCLKIAKPVSPKPQAMAVRKDCGSRDLPQRPALRENARIRLEKRRQRMADAERDMEQCGLSAKKYTKCDICHFSGVAMSHFDSRTGKLYCETCASSV